VLLDQVGQAQPVEQLHHVIELAGPGPPVVVDLDRVGVREPGRDADLALEPRQGPRVAGAVGGNQFEGAGALQELVLGQVDLAHPPRAEPPSQAILAELSGLPLPTIHRLTRTLVGLGYVRQLPSRQYALGPKLIRLGESATRMIGAWSRPHLVDLVKATGETANMAMLDGTMAVYVAQVPSEHSMRMFTEVGRRVYPHSTGVGKALLSQLSDDDVRRIVTRTGMPAQTANTITDPDALVADLELIRRRGYAVDEGEQEVGVRCFAVPVPSAPTPTGLMSYRCARLNSMYLGLRPSGLLITRSATSAPIQPAAKFA